MQAVILAGGLGTRLKEVVQDIPKPMAPIAGKPFLDYLLRHLAFYGIEKFLFLTGYKSEIIEEYLEREFSGKVVVEISREKSLLGTGGALLNAWDYLEEEFIMVNGDTYVNFDYTSFLNQRIIKTNYIILKHLEHSERYGSIIINSENIIKEFREKEMRNDVLINTGIYLLQKRSLQEYYSSYTFEKKISLESEIFPEMSTEGMLTGFVTDGDFIDIGVPEDYFLAQRVIPEIVEKLS